MKDVDGLDKSGGVRGHDDIAHILVRKNSRGGTVMHIKAGVWKQEGRLSFSKPIGTENFLRRVNMHE